MAEYLGGINSVSEALRSDRTIKRIYLSKDSRSPRLEEIAAEAKKRQIPCKLLDRTGLDRIYSGSPHQGVVAEVEAYVYADLDEVLAGARSRNEDPFLLLLDGIEDPQNLGSIIRTAECAGVHGVIIPRHHSAEITPAVVRASAGAVEHMAVIQETNLVNTIKRLKEEGLWIVGADMDGKTDYFNSTLPQPTALVIGGEGRGIRRLVRENCDLLVRIPMFGQVNSLNASVSAALLIYEIVRQKARDRT